MERCRYDDDHDGSIDLQRAPRRWYVRRPYRSRLNCVQCVSCAAMCAHRRANGRRVCDVACVTGLSIKCAPSVPIRRPQCTQGDAMSIDSAPGGGSILSSEPFIERCGYRTRALCLCAHMAQYMTCVAAIDDRDPSAAQLRMLFKV